MAEMILDGKEGSYRHLRAIAEFPTSRVHLVQRESDDAQFLLQVAKETKDGSAIVRAAYLHSVIAERSRQVEAEYAAVKTDLKNMLNYHLHFPMFVEGFVLPSSQGRRHALVAGFHHVKFPGDQMFAVSHFVGKQKKRTDLRTTVWVLGKALKALQFLHDAGILLGYADAGNMLIEPNQHYLVFFDLTAAEMRTEALTRSEKRDEIVQAAKAAVSLAGGNAETGEFPDDENGRLRPYIDSLLNLAGGAFDDANEAHAQHYRVANSLWGAGGFHPFAWFDNENDNAQKENE